MSQDETSPKFVVIGGGTGSFTLLSGLKHYVNNLVGLVNMSDDGGSTGILRDELGVLPPGDVRQCLVALSQSSVQMRELFNYRFPEGTFGGHSFGNLFLSAVQKMTDNFDDAVHLAGEVLNISGEVVPVTLTDSQLVMELQGKKTVGQHAVELAPIPTGVTPKLFLQPQSKLNPRAKAAIKEADLIVIAPGNLYASLMPTLVVKGMAAALQGTAAKVVYVCNLVNKAHQGVNFAVHDYVNELERFVGRGVIDYVLYNTDQPSTQALKDYALEGELPVRVDTSVFAEASYTAIGGKFLSHAKVLRDTNDKLIHRSLIRHDAKTISRALMGIYFANPGR